jgi:Zn-dependent alcohol dehydrogenase
MALPTNITTEALVVHRPGDKFEMTRIILDEVRADEVLVEMKYSGICHTVGSTTLVSIRSSTY